MPVTLLSQSAYARHRGCDEKAVRKAIAEQRITTVERDGKSFIDPDVADIQWARNTRARVRQDGSAAPAPATPTQAAPPPSPGNEPDYQSLRARREKAEAEEAEIRVARAAGRALDRERAERGAFDAFRELRDAAFSAVKSQARRVHGLTELREIELALEDELRQAFAGWEERMQARLQEAAQP